MDEEYVWENVRTLLNKGFTDEELRRFCHDESTFRVVYDQLTQHTNKTEMIDLIIGHADRHLQVKTLLHWAKKNNPARFEIHQPYTRISNDERWVKVPLMGCIAAGEPIMLFKDPDDADSEYVEVPSIKLPAKGDLYALLVRGTSMIDAMINDGDTVVIDRSKNFRNSDIVVAWLVDKQEVTLKCFYNEGKRIRLQPRNETLQPIYVELNNVEIYGPVVAIIPSDQSHRSIYII